MRILLCVLIGGFFSTTVFSLECHSCLSYCKLKPNGELSEDCDCAGNSTCNGTTCFAKVEMFSVEETAIIQKGCASNLPYGTSGCHYAGAQESVHCYCDGEKCNTKEKFDNYKPKQLPIVQCCECSEPRGEKCPEDKCERTCRGNYCLIDFDGVEQGCGLGLPRLQNFLRIQNYSDLQGSQTCARYQATQSTIVHGCVCTSPTGFCNRVNASREYQLEKVVSRRVDDQNYCYSLHQKSRKAFDKEIFKKSDTCEGHYCFISMTTSELVVENTTEIDADGKGSYVGLSRPRYEILAGCLKVDDDNKVSLGCTTEYSENSGNPISKHCICESHLCNYYNLLVDEDNTTLRQVILDQSHDHDLVNSPSEAAGAVLTYDPSLRKTSGISQVSVHFMLIFTTYLALF
uniref:Activin_recp domain-containing protein n=1 Tax=Bursaphelenchus xylophilus TaxID=6326 RepID=A0A1I7SQT0_BURXY